MIKKTLTISCCYLLLSTATVYAQNPHAGQDHSLEDGKMATSHATENGHAKAYPLETCVVTGLSLDSMGEPVEFTYKGNTFLLCCRNCINTIKAKPDTYIRKLADAYKHQAAKH